MPLTAKQVAITSLTSFKNLSTGHAIIEVSGDGAKISLEDEDPYFMLMTYCLMRELMPVSGLQALVLITSGMAVDVAGMSEEEINSVKVSDHPKVMRIRVAEVMLTSGASCAAVEHGEEIIDTTDEDSDAQGPIHDIFQEVARSVLKVFS